MLPESSMSRARTAAMNTLFHLPTGELISLTPAEARKADAYLFTKMQDATDPDRAAIQRLRDGLKPIIEPERQYADMGAYVAPGYVAGWERVNG